MASSVFYPCTAKASPIVPQGDNESVLRTDGWYFWDVTSKKVIKQRLYGPWRNGPSGKGPGKLGFVQSTGESIKVINSISGSYSNVRNISTSLGVEIGVKVEHAASFSVNVPKGKRYQIIYRTCFKRYKIIQTKFYQIDGMSSKTKDTKTSYVNVFSHWDFTWKEVK